MNPWPVLPAILMSAYMRSVMLAWVRKNNPEEACEILAANSTGRVRRHYPIENILHDPVRYRMDPQIQFQVMMRIERAGLDMLAIYHSHPQGPSFPSAIDIQEAFYPDAYTLIWFMDRDHWLVRGFLIRDNLAKPVDIQVQ